ncbi:uncharacterized protein F4817DRAFT_364869 [Daldinia loculata]|uniref:uncharacterized protein n=1 Tax=Daldinia loculata TaxID=103429 RepID=UPI0020C2542A|nr:uncharacterized protein F4817DRAFT_364869 [Daldinia loculata]KAI1651972.1 hypothetical protein F4817DRAFT_364869 [Daldinia loculata]
MLQLFDPPQNQQNYIICHVNRYIPDLDRYLTENVMLYLHGLESRDNLPDQSQQKRTSSYCEAVRHVLQLSLISDPDSKRLLRLDDPGVAEAYTSDENFHKVSEAHSEVVEAVKSLYDAGGMLHWKVYRFFCDISTLPALSIPYYEI